MKKLAVTVLAVLLLCISAWAQKGTAAGNPVSDTIRQLLQRQSKNLTAAAEEMPAEKYSFRPTPPQMNFGHLTLHIAESNNFLCAKISDTPEPQSAKLGETDAKEKLVQALKASFDYCASALGKVDDSRLGDPLTLWGGRQSTRAGAMFGLTNDWADHYAAAAMYLRLNGLLPPTAQPKK
jgi:uncharacterized damage-inducible protein DinB